MNKNFSEKWKGLSPTIKYIVYAVGVAILISILFFSFYKPDTKEVLYSNLTTKDAQAVTKELDKMGIEYVTEAEGTTIKIEGTHISKVRMDLASLNIINSGDLGDIYEKSSIGLSQSDKEKRYQAALKNQIERDLERGIDGIDTATLQLSLQEKKPFYEEEAEGSKATVVVKMTANHELNKKQVKGIQNFVSGAVKNLKPKEVSVLNEEGEELTDSMDGEDSGSSSYETQLKYSKETERMLRQDIETTLKRVYGYKNVIVNVRANINFDEVTSNIEKYSNEDSALVSKQESKESSIKRDGGTPGEAGTATNGSVPNYNTQNNGQGNITFEQNKSNLTENYEVGKTVETTKKKPNLNFVSISVILDEKEGLRTEGERKELEQTVAHAAGILDKNGDGAYDNGQVKVTQTAFKTEKTKDESTEKVKTIKPKTLLGMPLWLWFVIGGGVLLVIIIITWLIFRAKEKKEEKRLLEEMRKVPVQENRVSEHTDGDAVKEEKKMSLMEKATEKAGQNEVKTADYIKYMLKKEDEK